MIHILSFVLALYNEAEHIDLDSTTADRQLNNTTIRKLAREKINLMHIIQIQSSNSLSQVK